MKKIYITGISGTGKTTIANVLIDRGFHTISIDETDNLCHWVNKENGKVVTDEVGLNKQFIDTHDWICDIDYLKELMKKGDNTVIVLGSASNQNDFLDLFDKVLLLQCKPETFIERIEKRKDNVFGKDKTAQESILGWHKYFEDELLRKGAISIDAEKSIEDVVKQVVSEIDS